MIYSSYLKNANRKNIGHYRYSAIVLTSVLGLELGTVYKIFRYLSPNYFPIHRQKETPLHRRTERGVAERRLRKLLHPTRRRPLHRRRNHHHIRAGKLYCSRVRASRSGRETEEAQRA